MYTDPYLQHRLVIDHQRQLTEAVQQARLAEAAKQARRANRASQTRRSHPNAWTSPARLLARLARPV